MEKFHFYKLNYSNWSIHRIILSELINVYNELIMINFSNNGNWLPDVCHYIGGSALSSVFESLYNEKRYMYWRTATAVPKAIDFMFSPSYCKNEHFLCCSNAVEKFKIICFGKEKKWAVRHKGLLGNVSRREKDKRLKVFKNILPYWKLMFPDNVRCLQNLSRMKGVGSGSDGHIITVKYWKPKVLEEVSIFFRTFFVLWVHLCQAISVNQPVWTYWN